MPSPSKWKFMTPRSTTSHNPSHNPKIQAKIKPWRNLFPYPIRFLHLKVLNGHLSCPFLHIQSYTIHINSLSSYTNSLVCPCSRVSISTGRFSHVCKSAIDLHFLFSGCLRFTRGNRCFVFRSAYKFTYVFHLVIDDLPQCEMNWILKRKDDTMSVEGKKKKHRR